VKGSSIKERKQEGEKSTTRAQDSRPRELYDRLRTEATNPATRANLSWVQAAVDKANAVHKRGHGKPVHDETSESNVSHENVKQKEYYSTHIQQCFQHCCPISVDCEEAQTYAVLASLKTGAW